MILRAWSFDHHPLWNPRRHRSLQLSKWPIILLKQTLKGDKCLSPPGAGTVWISHQLIWVNGPCNNKKHNGRQNEYASLWYWPHNLSPQIFWRSQRRPRQENLSTTGWLPYLLPRHPKSFHCIKHLSATKSEAEIHLRNVISFKKMSVAAHLRSHLADNPGEKNLPRFAGKLMTTCFNKLQLHVQFTFHKKLRIISVNWSRLTGKSYGKKKRFWPSFSTWNIVYFW